MVVSGCGWLWVVAYFSITFKIGALKIFPNFKGKCLFSSLFNKVAALRACNFIKKILQHVFSCEICEIFKNTCFTEYPQWLLLP